MHSVQCMENSRSCQSIGGKSGCLAPSSAQIYYATHYCSGVSLNIIMVWLCLKNTMWSLKSSKKWKSIFILNPWCIGVANQYSLHQNGVWRPAIDLFMLCHLILRCLSSMHVLQDRQRYRTHTQREERERDTGDVCS